MKTLLIGLDGFDYVLTQKWMKEGKLPNLSRIAGEGRFSPLRSLVPPVSPAVWTSILTGLNPGRHGVFDFTIKEGRRVRLLCGFQREALNIFEILSHAGQGVMSIGFPATAPLGRIEGVVLAGYDSPFSVMGKKTGCHPAWLHDTLVETFGEDYLPFDEINQFKMEGESGMVEAAAKLAKSPLRRAALSLFLSRKSFAGPARLLAVYFPEGDAAGHQLWHLHDPHSPRREGRGHAVHNDDPLERVYRSIDSAVGLLEEGLRPDAIVIVSDHGMGGSGRNVLSINRLLVEAGFLKLKNGWRAPLFDMLGRFSRSAVRNLPPSLRDFVVGQGAKSVSDMSISMLRFGGMDWSRTAAFSEDLSYAPSIWLNRSGAENAFGKDERTAADKIIKELKTADRACRTVSSYFRREELYQGPFLKRIPDILLDVSLDNGYSYNLLPGHFRRMKQPVEPLEDGYLTGEKGGSRHGSHRSEGIFIARVPEKVDNDFFQAPMEIYDLAPFVLMLHGLEINRYFDGGKRFRAPSRISVSDLMFKDSCDPGADFSNYVKVKSRLEQLGYL